VVNGPISHCIRQETPMNRYFIAEPPRPDTDEGAEQDFDVWSLDEMDNFADEHLPSALAAHDADD
jgi:hypothetical protein